MTDIYDLIVVGTGVAATTIAEKCRKAGWRVAIVDRRPYGGTCMLRGCDPKKLLWSVAATVDQAQRFARDGFAARDVALSWPELIRFKRSFLKDAPGRSKGGCVRRVSIRCTAARISSIDTRLRSTATASRRATSRSLRVHGRGPWPFRAPSVC
jgi:pyruvate/2-oxoglutarate dehydrogenase complex dihydrolipoamide dehydrogenase (E3) component